MKQNSERLKKHENNSNESDFSENEIPDLNSWEAVVRKCSVKKVFLEILQKSQEKSFVRACFLIKLQVSGLQLCQKREEILAQLFSCEFCEISKNTFYYKTALVTASDSLKPF